MLNFIILLGFLEEREQLERKKKKRKKNFKKGLCREVQD